MKTRWIVFDYIFFLPTPQSVYMCVGGGSIQNFDCCVSYVLQDIHKIMLCMQYIPRFIFFGHGCLPPICDPRTVSSHSHTFLEVWGKTRSGEVSLTVRTHALKLFLCGNVSKDIYSCPIYQLCTQIKSTALIEDIYSSHIHVHVYRVIPKLTFILFILQITSKIIYEILINVIYQTSKI